MEEDGEREKERKGRTCPVERVEDFGISEDEIIDKR